MTERIIVNEWKSRPANPNQYDTSEQIGKPLAYLFFSLVAAGTGVVLIVIHSNRIYQCSPFFWNELALAVGVGLLLAGFVQVCFLIASLVNREYPLIEEERQYQEPEPEPPRLVRIQRANDAPGLIEISNRGRATCGVFFPHRILRMVKDLGEWPSRKNFWNKPAVWQGTKEPPWHPDLYQKNTDLLLDGGIIERYGNGFRLTANGRKFFEIDTPPPN